MSTDDSEIAMVLGTRPEIIKLAPVVRECERRDIPFSILHTGQHYDEELNESFFNRLGLPNPTVNLGVGSGPQGEQTGEMIRKLEPILIERDPQSVLVQGDTNSVLAGTVVASKLDVQLGHVEAGLRSYNRKMPEETNRRLADHAADILFAPTETAAETLREEAIDEHRIHLTGNTVVDAIHEHVDRAGERSTIRQELNIETGEFALLTIHRAENVDDSERFERLLTGIEAFGNETGLEMIYPIHPRAKKSLKSADLALPECVRTIEPLGYLDFIELEQHAAIVLTDSGGVQEESCILGTPCVTLRESTERPETVDVGANVLAGRDPDDIRKHSLRMLHREGSWTNPFGDGEAARRIVDAIVE